MKRHLFITMKYRNVRVTMDGETQMESNPKVRIIPAKEENIRIEKVGIYARVSTAGKAQLRSLAAQISGLTRGSPGRILLQRAGKAQLLRSGLRAPG